jgi:hypothetical protein
MANGYGGKRSGAGRPKGTGKPLAVRIEASERRELEELTREAAAKKALVYVVKAFKTLEKVMDGAESDQLVWPPPRRFSTVPLASPERPRQSPRAMP